MVYFYTVAEKITGLIGPGTVLCDHMSYVFMFLSVATSNMVATSLAKQVIFTFYSFNTFVFFLMWKRLKCYLFSLQDKKEAQHQISVLLFIGLVCGLMMLLLTRIFGPWAVTGKHFYHPILSKILSEMYLAFCDGFLQLLQGGRTLRLYLQLIHIFRFLFF